MNTVFFLKTLDKHQAMWYNVDTMFSTKFLSELKDGVTKFLNGEIGNE